ncbi:hypothetical protein CASFOL_031538 [Castilleja foliolosa]|uniref:Protein NUCLEAR FUSION DEFECTIVE 6, chloroplastic/mitochondrial-like n=1 Tax=Castilleja foliolosa TaxID=1961234 RepID=A0ABD3C4Z0_9LAMI
MGSISLVGSSPDLSFVTFNLESILGNSKELALCKAKLTQLKPRQKSLPPSSLASSQSYRMSTFAARSFIRSATTSARSATARLSGGVKPRASPSPFRIASQKPLSARIFRSPVEMSSVSVVSMLPYHSVTASALLNSMLSISPCGQGWSIEDCNDDV